jgi:hypothetical protein
LSIFRTAYKSSSPSALRDVILKHFGRDRGLIVSKAKDLEAIGLRYEPKYVLPERQIDLLIRGVPVVFGSGAIA